MINILICHTFKMFTKLVLPIEMNRTNWQKSTHISDIFFFWHAFWEYPHALTSQPHIEECGEKLKPV